MKKLLFHSSPSLSQFSSSLLPCHISEPASQPLQMDQEARQLHIFFFPLMAQSHTIPMIDIARLFAARGIKSSIISTPLNAPHISEIIDRDRQQSGLDIAIQILPFPAVEAGLPEGCENLNWVTSAEMVFSFFKALRILQQPFKQLLEQLRPDAVVADVLLNWTTDIANEIGIPRLLFHGTSIFSMIVMEIIEHTWISKASAAMDSESFVVPGLPDRIEFTKSQLPDTSDPFWEIKVKMQETEVESFGILVNSFYDLEPGYADYYKKDMRRRAWNIGPVSLYNRNIMDKVQRGRRASIDEHHCLSWLDSKEPDSVLYVCFGSVSSFSTAQLNELALGLEASEVPFIWVVRAPENEEAQLHFPEGLEGRTEGKGLIIREWAPQVLILDHPAVGGFMTHCGWNSTLEGITAGLPLITWPLFAEQFNNEKFVVQVLKTGIQAGNGTWSAWIQPKDVSVTKERVKEVVIELMGDGEEAKDMRIRARKLKEQARMALEKGGSSYNELNAVIEELRAHSQQKHTTKNVKPKD